MQNFEENKTKFLQSLNDLKKSVHDKVASDEADIAKFMEFFVAQEQQIINNTLYTVEAKYKVFDSMIMGLENRAEQWEVDVSTCTEAVRGEIHSSKAEFFKEITEGIKKGVQEVKELFEEYQAKSKKLYNSLESEIGMVEEKVGELDADYIANAMPEIQEKINTIPVNLENELNNIKEVVQMKGKTLAEDIDKIFLRIEIHCGILEADCRKSMNDELLLTQIRNAIVGAIEEAQNEIRAQMERLIGEAEYLMETGAAQIEELFHTAQYELHNFTETTSKDISNCVKEKEKDIMSVKKEMLTQFEECISIGIQELHRTADEFQANFQRVLRSVSSDSLKVFPPSREQTIDKVDSDEQIPEEPLPTSLLDIPKKLAQNVVRTMKELTVIMGDLENCIAPIVQLSTKRIKWILDELKFCVETNEEPIND